MKTEQSGVLFEKSKKNIPGGVNSPVRAFANVGGTPIFMRRAQGAYMEDADGNVYIDYINSWGPMILGHAHPEAMRAIHRQIDRAFSFGAPTEEENDMAELIKGMNPGIDMARLVSSGTEACMSALRLARGYTGKNKFIKFEGCYHGHADPFLVKAGSGIATLGIERVPGVPSGVVSDTLIAPFNDIEKVKSLIDEHGKDIAAIIIEPVAGNMGCIPPAPGFLEELRRLCELHGIVFILDEVMTGFRLAKGGAQERLKIDADIVAYGKIIGGGMPLAAFAGKRSIMEHIAPLGKVYQAGTLSGNPVAVACGYATLSILNKDPDIYKRLDRKTETLKKEMGAALHKKGIAHTINQIGSMISLHFGEREVTDFKTAAACDIPLFNRFFHHMLEGGVYLPPSAFETWFVSDSLSDADIEKTISRVEKFNP